ncbi:MAG: hypothetical protein KatS3mg031_2841 [Chitinophagales bacterium]|nr:MAG: hypothetical protein KatS3mg031_2841 [Chitinophagales bacterium]
MINLQDIIYIKNGLPASSACWRAAKIASAISRVLPPPHSYKYVAIDGRGGYSYELNRYRVYQPGEIITVSIYDFELNVGGASSSTFLRFNKIASQRFTIVDGTECDILVVANRGGYEGFKVDYVSAAPRGAELLDISLPAAYLGDNTYEVGLTVESAKVGQMQELHDSVVSDPLAVFYPAASSALSAVSTSYYALVDAGSVRLNRSINKATLALKAYFNLDYPDKAILI